MSDGGPVVGGIDLDGVREVLDRESIEYAVLFGSRARGTADASADVDVAVRFADSLTARESFDLRNRLDAELQSYAERFVDLSDLSALPDGVASRALADGVLLVGEREAMEADEREIARRLEEKRDRRERARRALLDRLARGES